MNFTCKRYLARSSFTRCAKKVPSAPMVHFRKGPDQNRFGNHLFLFPTCKRSPLFGTVLLHSFRPSACGLVSGVFVSLALSVSVSKKQRVNALYPFLVSLRTVPFFIRSITKLVRVNGHFLSEPFQFLSGL